MRKFLFILLLANFGCHKEPKNTCENNIYMEVYRWDIPTSKYVIMDTRLTPECACIAIEDRNYIYEQRPPEQRYKYKCLK